MKITLVTACAIALATAPALFAKKPAEKKTPDKSEESSSTVAGSVPTTPGAHKKLPCPKNPKLTYDIYLPKGYSAVAGSAPVEGYPALFISSPGANPGFRGYEAWADANGVLLVGINDSRNGDWKPIIEAQDAVLDAVKAYRIHPCLRFATGQSGGGQASGLLTASHPKEFAGALLQCHSVFEGMTTKPPASHLCYGFIGGLKDTTHPDSVVREGAARARKTGHYVQEEHLDMGHVWGPKDVVGRMLSNMLTYARMTHPGLSVAEKKNAEKLPDSLIASALAESDPVKACSLVDPLVSIDAFKSKPFRAPALDAWCSARAKTIDALSGLAAFEALVDKDTRERFDDSRGKSKPAVDALRKKIESDPALKTEVPAWKDFQKLTDAYDRENARSMNAKSLKDWKTKFSKFSKKFEGTFAATKAGELAK